MWEVPSGGLKSELKEQSELSTSVHCFLTTDTTSPVAYWSSCQTFPSIDYIPRTVNKTNLSSRSTSCQTFCQNYKISNKYVRVFKSSMAQLCTCDLSTREFEVVGFLGLAGQSTKSNPVVQASERCSPPTKGSGGYLSKKNNTQSWHLSITGMWSTKTYALTPAHT